MKVTAIRGFVLNGKTIKPGKKVLTLTKEQYFNCKPYVQLVEEKEEKPADKE